MGRYDDILPNRGLVALLPAAALMALLVLLKSPTAHAFALQHPSSRLPIAPALSTIASSTSLFAMNKRNKFNKQKDLAAKMAEAKRQRELAEGGGEALETVPKEDEHPLSAAEIKLRNDQKRFADLLENSLTSSGGDLEKGYYLTEQQENENADAVFRGVVRLYEGDPAPTAPFAELLSIENGEPIGKGGMKRLVPWEGSRSSTSADYLVVVTDPRPKSPELRTAMKRLAGALSSDALKKCLVINTDTPAENRRFVKRNLPTEGDGPSSSSPLRIMCDENMEWMREYTALGEKRFSMTVFVLRGGRVERIAREVEAEVLPDVVKNAIRSL